MLITAQQKINFLHNSRYGCVLGKEEEGSLNPKYNDLLSTG